MTTHRKILTALVTFGALALAACGGLEPGVGDDDGEIDRQAQAACAAYLCDNPDYSGPLAPWPVAGMAGQCINLPAASNNRTSSFRLAGCGAIFFDDANCSGASYMAATSGVMPLVFNNRTTSIRFF